MENGFAAMNENELEILPCYKCGSHNVMLNTCASTIMCVECLAKSPPFKLPDGRRKKMSKETVIKAWNSVPRKAIPRKSEDNTNGHQT